MTFVHSFPPVVRADTRVLVLGSMPGKASLRAQQYYAHPRNNFWRFAAELFGIEHALPYDARVAALLDARVGLWDVMKSCTRESSLDSDIDESSIVPNDFAALLAAHPELTTIGFNGAKAAQAFERYVVPGLTTVPALLRLPSTSPANASIPLEEKRSAWEAIAAAARSDLPHAGGAG